MQIKTRLSQSEFIKLTGMLLLKRLQIQFLILANIGLIIAALIAIFVYHNESAYMLIFVGVVFLSLFAFSITNNAKRQYQANPRISEELTYQFTDKGFQLSKEGYTTTVSWNEIIRIRKKAGLILLWQNKLIAHVISEKAIDDAEWIRLQKYAHENHISCSN